MSDAAAPALPPPGPPPPPPGEELKSSAAPSGEESIFSDFTLEGTPPPEEKEEAAPVRFVVADIRRHLGDPNPAAHTGAPTPFTSSFTTSEAPRRLSLPSHFARVAAKSFSPQPVLLEDVSTELSVITVLDEIEPVKVDLVHQAPSVKPTPPVNPTPSNNPTQPNKPTPPNKPVISPTPPNHSEITVIQDTECTQSESTLQQSPPSQNQSSEKQENYQPQEHLPFNEVASEMNIGGELLIDIREEIHNYQLEHTCEQIVLPARVSISLDKTEPDFVNSSHQSITVFASPVLAVLKHSTAPVTLETLNNDELSEVSEDVVVPATATRARSLESLLEPAILLQKEILENLVVPETTARRNVAAELSSKSNTDAIADLLEHLNTDPVDEVPVQATTLERRKAALNSVDGMEASKLEEVKASLKKKYLDGMDEIEARRFSRPHAKNFTDNSISSKEYNKYAATVPLSRQWDISTKPFDRLPSETYTSGEPDGSPSTSIRTKEDVLAALRPRRKSSKTFYYAEQTGSVTIEEKEKFYSDVVEGERRDAEHRSSRPYEIVKPQRNSAADSQYLPHVASNSSGSEERYIAVPVQVQMSAAPPATTPLHTEPPAKSQPEIRRSSAPVHQGLAEFRKLEREMLLVESGQSRSPGTQRKTSAPAPLTEKPVGRAAMVARQPVIEEAEEVILDQDRKGAKLPGTVYEEMPTELLRPAGGSRFRSTHRTPAMILKEEIRTQQQREKDLRTHRQEATTK